LRVPIGHLLGDPVPIQRCLSNPGHLIFINDSYPRATSASGELQTEKDWTVETTVVRRGASIGSGATILSKVVIGKNAIIEAGSVGTLDVPPKAIVTGNPARVLRYISTEPEPAT